MIRGRVAVKPGSPADLVSCAGRRRVNVETGGLAGRGAESKSGRGTVAIDTRSNIEQN